MENNNILQRIENALDWFEGTDGSERERAGEEMYNILIDLVNDEKFIEYCKQSAGKRKQQNRG